MNAAYRDHWYAWTPGGAVWHLTESLDDVQQRYHGMRAVLCGRGASSTEPFRTYATEPPKCMGYRRPMCKQCVRRYETWLSLQAILEHHNWSEFR